MTSASSDMADFITKLVEDLGSQLLVIPFDAWLQVCERTRERLMKKFPGVVLEEIPEDKARVWYLRYRNHCSETYSEFLKSVINCQAEYSTELVQMIREKHPKNLRKNFSLASTAPLCGTKQKTSASAIIKTPEVRHIVDYDDDDDAMSVVSSICDGPFKVPMPSFPPDQNNDDFTPHARNGFANNSKKTYAPWSPTIVQRNMEDWEVGSEVGGRRSPARIIPELITSDRLEQEIFDGGNDLARSRWDSPERKQMEKSVTSLDIVEDVDDEPVDWCKRLRRIALPKRNNLVWKKYVLKQMLTENTQFIESPNLDLRFEDPRYLKVCQINDNDDSDDDVADDSFETNNRSLDSVAATCGTKIRADSDSGLGILFESPEPIYSQKQNSSTIHSRSLSVNPSSSDIKSPSSSSDSTIMSPTYMTPFHLTGNRTPVVGISPLQLQPGYVQQVRPDSATPLAALNINNAVRPRPCPPPPPMIGKGRERVRKAPSPPRYTAKKPTRWTDWHRR